MTAIPVVGIVFSKDRAMQLDACLRSFYLNCQDPENARLSVLFCAGTPRHAAQYAELSAEPKARQNVRFVRETYFRGDVLGILLDHSPLANFRRETLSAARRLPGSLSGAANSFFKLRKPAYVLFLVDDTLFTRPFSLETMIACLQERPQAIGFSLRLGSNTDFCYPQDRPQQLPAFTPAGSGIQSFDWTRAELDFNYPLEVSSSLYNLELIYPLLNAIQFTNPNNLESRMAAKAGEYALRYPQLLSYQTSAAFSNPVNIVQLRDRNRVGQQVAYSTDELAELFDSGCRIDVANFQSFVPHSCHQEIGFEFIQSGRNSW
jgi:hypothetical protein